MAVVSVNYNTALYISYLLFSLCRIIGRHNLGEIVIVDNGSTDGSKEILRGLHKAGLITLIANEKQQYHGPGLNQGMSYLADKARKNPRQQNSPDYVLVLDSDIIILRPTILDDLLIGMKKWGGGLAGEIENFDHVEGGYAHVSSILIDPTQVWRRGITPFEEHGVPAMILQRDLVRKQILRYHFPLRSAFYVLHLWNGTLRAIRDSAFVQNKYYGYASTLKNNNAEDFPQGRYLLEEFRTIFNSEVPALTPLAVVNACLQQRQIVLQRPFELLKQFKPVTVWNGDGCIVED